MVFGFDRPKFVTWIAMVSYFEIFSRTVIDVINPFIKSAQYKTLVW